MRRRAVPPVYCCNARRRLVREWFGTIEAPAAATALRRTSVGRLCLVFPPSNCFPTFISRAAVGRVDRNGSGTLSLISACMYHGGFLLFLVVQDYCLKTYEP